jgi:hypothetical protein
MQLQLLNVYPTKRTRPEDIQHSAITAGMWRLKISKLIERITINQWCDEHRYKAFYQDVLRITKLSMECERWLDNMEIFDMVCYQYTPI